MLPILSHLAPKVAIHRSKIGVVYPSVSPYHPSESYPEYPFEGFIGNEPNPAYESVRGAFLLMGLDSERYGTSDWNPLADIVSPNDFTVIKPNMVRDFHEKRKEGHDALTTHGSVIRAIVDYVFLAKNGKGEIAICDSPQNDGNWEELWKNFGFTELLDFYAKVAPDFKINIYDIRMEAVIKKNGVVVKRYKRPEDPHGYARINLGENSEFAPVPERYGKLFGAEYDISATTGHHSEGVHEYFVGSSFLKADVIINVPKLKTHKKSGLTVWIKSAVGICGDKNWLPHHTEGTPSQGGDQFAENTLKKKTEQRVTIATKKALRNAGPVGGYIGSFLRKMGSYVFGDTNKDAVRSGNWFGNDTVWRMVFDLHKCWIYADKNGVLQQTPQRKFLCVVDGIVGGEGNGPLDPTRRDVGVVLCGADPIAVDTAAAVLVGFDPSRLKILTQSPHSRGFKLDTVAKEDIQLHSNNPKWNGSLDELQDPLNFAPHFGWVGYLESPARRKQMGITNGKAELYQTTDRNIS